MARTIDSTPDDGWLLDADSPDVRMRQLEEQWERFHQGLAIDRRLVRPVILRSWLRCRENGILCADGVQGRLTAARLQEMQQEKKHLIRIASTMMQILYDHIKRSRCFIFLVSGDGVILHTVADEADLRDHPAYRPGHCNDEKITGTNAAGTCLVEKAPLYVLAAEHYARYNHLWHCAAAPIEDLHGQTAACLSIAIERNQFNYHTFGLVVAAASSIMEQLKLSTLLGEQQAIMEILSEGVIVLNDAGRIQMMNRYARSMFQVDSLEDGPPLSLLAQASPQTLSIIRDPESRLDCEASFQLHNGSTLNCTLSTSPTQLGGVVITLRDSVRMHNLANKVVGAKAIYTFDNILGNSFGIRDALRMARIASNSDATTLILGESGTGKELFAQAIHNNSGRSSGPFIVVNCGAIPRNLVQSELFGYEGGAFTGALREGMPGKFELAHGGTLFLDEIGDMPLDAQANLLRVLQEGEVLRLGSKKYRRINVRVIAATHRNIFQAVENGAFRQDLYYRLNVLPVNVPPLRERKTDIIPLADYFLGRFAEALKRPVRGFSQAALHALMAYDWPGNVRELENIVERAVNMTSRQLIEPEALPQEIVAPENVRARPDPFGLESSSLTGAESLVLARTMRQYGGNIRAAARHLGISRTTLYNKLRKHNIERSGFGQAGGN